MRISPAPSFYWTSKQHLHAAVFRMSDPFFVSHSITWLADNASPHHYSGGMDVPRQPSIIPKEVGVGSFEIMAIKPGLTLAHTTHAFPPEQAGQIIALADMEMTLNEPALAIQSANAGRVIVKDHVSNKELTLTSDQSIFQHQHRIAFTMLHDASQDNDLALLLISKSVLCDLLGERIAHGLLEAQKITDAPAARSFNIPRNISDMLHSATTNSVMDDLRKLRVQGKILEYLSLLSNFTLGDQEPASSPQRTRLIRQAHEELINLKGAVPKLSEFSKKYGLSARTLNNDFKKEFGNSIYAFVKDQRLAEAHKALEETNTPIKVIAANVGYAHVTNFMLAFKKRYGYPPGSLRR